MADNPCPRQKFTQIAARDVPNSRLSSSTCSGKSRGGSSSSRRGENGRQEMVWSACTNPKQRPAWNQPHVSKLPENPEFQLRSRLVCLAANKRRQSRRNQSCALQRSRDTAALRTRVRLRSVRGKAMTLDAEELSPEQDSQLRSDLEALSISALNVEEKQTRSSTRKLL